MLFSTLANNSMEEPLYKNSNKSARDIFDMEDSNTCDKVGALSNIAK